jgi:hypothetical protein
MNKKITGCIGKLQRVSLSQLSTELFATAKSNRIRAALAEKQYGILRTLLVVIFDGTEVRVTGPSADIERPPSVTRPVSRRRHTALWIR